MPEVSTRPRGQFASHGSSAIRYVSAGQFVVRRSPVPVSLTSSSAGTYRRNALSPFGGGHEQGFERDFFHYADRLMLDIGSGGWEPDLADAPTSAAMQKARSLLRQVARPSTVYPAIAPDGDGGLDIQWVADGHSLRLTVDSVGAVSVKMDRKFGAVVDETPVNGTKDLVAIMRALAELTQYVERHNPSWRRWFRH